MTNRPTRPTWPPIGGWREVLGVSPRAATSPPTVRRGHGARSSPVRRRRPRSPDSSSPCAEGRDRAEVVRDGRRHAGRRCPSTLPDGPEPVDIVGTGGAPSRAGPRPQRLDHGVASSSPAPASGCASTATAGRRRRPDRPTCSRRSVSPSSSTGPAWPAASDERRGVLLRPHVPSRHAPRRPGSRRARRPDGVQLPRARSRTPAGVRRQVIGVSDPALAPTVIGVLAGRGAPTGDGRARSRRPRRADHHRAQHRPRAPRRRVTDPRFDPAELGIDGRRRDRGGRRRPEDNAGHRPPGASPARPGPYRDIVLAQRRGRPGRRPAWSTTWPTASSAAAASIDSGAAARVVARTAGQRVAGGGRRLVRRAEELRRRHVGVAVGRGGQRGRRRRRARRPARWRSAPPGAASSRSSWSGDAGQHVGRLAGDVPAGGGRAPSGRALEPAAAAPTAPRSR